MRLVRLSSFLLLLLVSLYACKKNPTAPAPSNPGNGGTSSKLNYGDSVFYVKDVAYTVSPAIPSAGTYSAYPDNLMIDPSTGKITVSIMGKGGESQTGLRYKIKFVENGTGKTDSTYIVLAGITYLDKIYNLAQNDTIIHPVYNADLLKNLPTGTYGIQADTELGIISSDGRINIKECIRRGLFNIPAENGEWEEVTINYRSSDNSNSSLNRIDIALYYYDTVNDIPYNVSTVMRAHQQQVLGVAQPTIPITTGPFDDDLPDNLSLLKPRPPCVIIVGH